MTSERSSLRRRFAGPGRLRALPDDRLGELTMAVIVSELRWTPDVAPAVIDRLTRDAVAYPEHLGRPAESPASEEPPASERARRPLARRLVAAVLGGAILLVIVGLLLLEPRPALGVAGDPAGLALELETIASGFDQPLQATGDGTGAGQLYVVEQAGRVRLVEADGTVRGEPFLDLSERVALSYEQGLLGLAFHPGYPENGRLFVDYTRRADGATVVSELSAREGRADIASERVILTVEQPFENHNGGTLAFDASGRLLVGMGDGGGGGDPLGSAQDPGSLLGKLLRLDVDGEEPYAIPEDNGYLDDEAYRPEIHASGLRNPWRFSVDRAGGHIYIGDVGEGRWEEVSVLPEGRGGVSLGWSVLEGPECVRQPCRPEEHVPPALAYGRDEGCTIIGGHAYRGTSQPLLDGVYLFGDYCSGTIWGVPAADLLGRAAEAHPLVRLDGTLVSFGTDDAGEILVVDQGGRVLRAVARADDSRGGASLLSARRTDVPGGEPLAAQASPSPTPTSGGDGADGSPAPSPRPSGEPVEAGAQGDGPGVAIRLVPVVSGLASPVSIVRDGTGSGLLYVVERGGVIRVLASDGIRSDPLLDISALVGTNGEQGLHDVAFHPRFERNGRFFVHYNDLAGDTRLHEFQVRRGRTPVDPDSGRRILEVEQPFINNNGGWLAFGPDGYLYLALGDGGGPSPGDPSGYGQRRDTLLAKVLRLDVDRGRRYTVPRDNPFTSRRQRRVFAPETWVWGLREPRRASFDRLTGDLWIGEMGQDSFEEIDLVAAGESGLNFGWSAMEGDRCHLVPDCDPSEYAAPIHVYDRAPPHCGVVGGHVYRGEAIPELVGWYLFSDLCSGVIWGLHAETARRAEKTTPVVLLDAPEGMRAFGEDDAGELYAVSLEGTVFRIEAEDRE